jgi:hypothetical protein
LPGLEHASLLTAKHNIKTCRRQEQIMQDYFVLSTDFNDKEILEKK